MIPEGNFIRDYAIAIVKLVVAIGLFRLTLGRMPTTEEASLLLLTGVYLKVNCIL